MTIQDSIKDWPEEDVWGYGRQTNAEVGARNAEEGKSFKLRVPPLARREGGSSEFRKCGCDEVMEYCLIFFPFFSISIFWQFREPIAYPYRQLKSCAAGATWFLSFVPLEVASSFKITVFTEVLPKILPPPFFHISALILLKSSLSFASFASFCLNSFCVHYSLFI